MNWIEYDTEARWKASGTSISSESEWQKWSILQRENAWISGHFV